MPELAEDVERLTRFAYPSAAPEQAIILLAKDQFINALPDEDIRLRLRQSHPSTMQQALETALDLHYGEQEVQACARGTAGEEQQSPEGSCHAVQSPSPRCYFSWSNV